MVTVPGANRIPSRTYRLIAYVMWSVTLTVAPAHVARAPPPPASGTDAAPSATHAPVTMSNFARVTSPTPPLDRGLSVDLYPSVIHHSTLFRRTDPSDR